MTKEEIIALKYLKLDTSLILICCRLQTHLDLNFPFHSEEAAFLVGFKNFQNPTVHHIVQFIANFCGFKHMSFKLNRDSLLIRKSLWKMS